MKHKKQEKQYVLIYNQCNINTVNEGARDLRHKCMQQHNLILSLEFIRPTVLSKIERRSYETKLKRFEIEVLKCWIPSFL